jgi:transcription termination factor Rho
MKQIWLLRRMISLISNDGSSSNATERVLERLAKYSTNKEFLENLNKDA